MIGLGSSIVSLPDFKNSANFDGVDDYIDTRFTFEDVFKESFTISFWVKPNDGDTDAVQYIFAAQSSSPISDANMLRCQIDDNGDFRLFFKANNQGASFKTNQNTQPFFPDGQAVSWTHVLVSVSKPSSGLTTVKIYKNGIEQNLSTHGDMSVTNHSAFQMNETIPIGARNNKGTVMNRFNGGIDEFAIFTSALSASSALSIYNNGSPLDLRSSSGGYTLSNLDNLQTYYKMGDGLFDDKTNGVIHDQINPGFGSNLVVNGNFSDGTNNWSFAGGSTLVNGAARITNLESGGNSYIITGVNNDDTSGQIGIIGKVYKLEYDVVAIGENNTATYLIIEGTPSTNDVQLPTTSVGTNKVVYFIFTKDSNRLVIKRHAGFGSNTDITLDNIRLSQLNEKPLLTSNTGDVTFSSDTPTPGIAKPKFSASFDGVGDFIVLGKSNEIIPNNKNEITVMTFVKFNTIGVSGSAPYIFSNIRSNAVGSNIGIRESSSKLQLVFYKADGSLVIESNNTISTGRWYHVAVTIKSGEQKLYVDGVAQSQSGTVSFDVPDSNGDDIMVAGDTDCTIGTFGGHSDQSTSIYHMDGLVSELAIFDTALTSSIISSLYKSRFDFSTHVGDYVNSINLTHHYKMGGGIDDDRTKGIIRNQINLEFGSNLVVGGDFPSESSFNTNWVNLNSTPGGNEAFFDNGKIKINYDPNLNNAAVGIQKQNILEAGKAYRLKIDVNIISGDSIKVHAINQIQTNIGTGSHTIIFVATGTSFAIYRNSIHSAVVATIDNVSLEELNGNPGITSSIGDVIFSSDTPL